MKQTFLYAVCGVILVTAFSGCAGINSLLKSGQPELIYSKALEYYQKEKWSRASTLFEGVQHYYIGTPREDSVSFFNARCKFKNRDYDTASALFDDFRRKFGRSAFIEDAEGMYALCFYYLSPGPSRDQTMTGQALIAINEFMSRYPHSEQIENFKTINSIDPAYYEQYDVKRGLRNADGTEMDFSGQGIERLRQEKEAFERSVGRPVHDFEWFSALYREMPFRNPAYHALFALLEGRRVPVLFHCSCGKDRTGIGAMLILLALGVSRADALADYMLTNVYRREIIERFLADKPAAERDLLLPVEGVSEPMGAGAIDEILRRYPSYEAYFADEFGLDAARLKALRDFYLE